MKSRNLTWRALALLKLLSWPELIEVRSRGVKGTESRYLEGLDDGLFFGENFLKRWPDNF